MHDVVGRPAVTADVTILGAGIAGLAAAIACARRGLAVEVIEQAPALREVGAGLQIAPNGARVLDALGVDIPHIESRTVALVDGPTGQPVLRMPLAAPFRLVHRADLIAGLASVAENAGVALHLGQQVRRVTEAGLETAGGLRPYGRLIGADGVRGASRAFVAPDHAAGQGRRFTGQVAWRATVPVTDWPHETRVQMGPGRHLVLYPLRDGRLLNIVGVEERADWTPEGWDIDDDPDHLRAAFAGYAAPVRALLDRVEVVKLWGLMDHGATPRWTRGRVTLIGDAAHPTLPFLAQGANLALEDAWTLAATLDDPAGWEASRRPRVERALAAARGNATNYHLSGMRRIVGHGVLRALDRVTPGAMARRYDWLYGHDVTKG